MHNICILGATGSVGAAALAIVADHPERYRARILVGGGNAQRMAALCRLYRPELAVMANEAAAMQLQSMLADESIAVVGGELMVLAAAADPDCPTVIAAIAGSSGVRSALAAAAAGKRLLLANKEALIVAGSLLVAAVEDGGGELLPVDSEHCALFELLQGDENHKKLWLTASGGSVRQLPLADLPNVTPKMALAHPNWSMGRKITVDSATMMNKVLEVMEAAVLYNTEAKNIGVVIHPQSTCHALVEYSDGTLTASWSRPDMRLSISRMLEWPARLAAAVPPIGWEALSQASFTPPDSHRYPCLTLAYEALALGGAAPAALSAANEVAVERFLAGDIKFTDIVRINSDILSYLHGQQTAANSMEEIWHMDATARRLAAQHS